MKVRITFTVSREEREAAAFIIDGKRLGRLATRDEMKGVIMDGAENSLINIVSPAYEAAKAARGQGATEEK